MTRRQYRAAWTGRDVSPPRQHGAREGIAVHWPGEPVTIRSHDDCLAYLRAWERFHVEGRGWSALGYNQAACRHGYVIDGRGVRAQSGANGNSWANDRFGSVLCILGPGEKPNLRMKRAVHAARKLQAPGKRFLTHNQARQAAGLAGTACPGPVLSRWVAGGAKLAQLRKPKLPAVSLTLVRRDARWANWAKHGGKAREADERLVRQALDDVGAATYAAWQRRLGYRGKDADGVPGRVSLRKLGRKTGRFRVVR